MLVDRLEAAGWVVRQPHPSDRRYILIELSAQAAEQAPAGLATYHSYIRALVAGVLPQHRPPLPCSSGWRPRQRAGQPRTSAVAPARLAGVSRENRPGKARQLIRKTGVLGASASHSSREASRRSPRCGRPPGATLACSPSIDTRYSSPSQSAGHPVRPARTVHPPGVLVEQRLAIPAFTAIAALAGAGLLGLRPAATRRR